MDDELRAFRSSVRRFVQKELLPKQERWREQGYPDRDAWLAAGEIGMLLPDVPEEYGGGGGTFAHEAVVLEELARSGIHFDSRIQCVVGHHILAYGSEEQKRAWLPRLSRGELVGALAITEPMAGSDVQAIATTARRDGAHYVVSGSKTFVSNGSQADLVCLAVKTDARAAGPRGISLLVVETGGLPGFRAGRPLEKLGLHGEDTNELFFDGARVPAANLLGPAEGKGFGQIMTQLAYERLTVGVSAVAAAERAVALTVAHVKQRTAFGQPLMDFQNTRFTLAACKTETQVGRVFLDSCIQRAIAGRLDTVTAAMAKYWLSECQWRVADACLQLHGGYGYMTEYPIARIWADARVQRIYAGSNEVMKEVIGCSL